MRYENDIENAAIAPLENILKGLYLRGIQTGLMIRTDPFSISLRSSSEELVYNQVEENLEENLESSTEENAEMSESSNAFEKLIEEKINNIDKRMTESQQHLSELLNMKIDSIDTKLDSKLETRLKGIEKSLDATVEGIGKKLDAQIDDMKDAVKETNEQIRHVQNENRYIFYAFLGIAVAIFIAIFFKV